MMLPVLLGLFATAVAGTTEKVFFPNPSGKYYVGKTQHVFNHTTPNDPVAPKGSHHTGKIILVTIHYPTTQAPTAETSLKYMDHKLAHRIEQGWGFPAGSLQKLWTPSQWQPPILPGEVGKNPLPTLLFSPGAGMPCSSSTMIQAEMTSRGYTVLCVDHPGEPPYLKLPYGGGGVEGLPIDYPFDFNEFAYQIYDNRKADYDALLELYPPLVEEFGAPFNTTSYIHFGFSLGGSLGTDIVSRHDAVLGSINYDGSFIDTYLGNTVDLRKPILMMRDWLLNATNDPTWGWFEGNQTGWWEHVKVKGSHHLNFSDVGLWFELLGLTNEDVETELVGKIKGTRMTDIQAAFTTAFFDKVLGKKECLLESPLPSNEWPEVLLIKKSRGESD